MTTTNCNRLVPTVRQYRAARKVWADYRAQYGMAHAAADMVSFGGNTKTAKNKVATYDLSLSHANNASSGKVLYAPIAQGNGRLVEEIAAEVLEAVGKSRLFGINTCPFSTPACRAVCVSSTGKGGLPAVKFARAVKTRFMQEYPVLFRILVMFELAKAVVKTGGHIMARLNCYSDVRWEDFAPEFFTLKGVDFYDYTKHPVSSRPVALPNYRVTRSATERTTVADIRLSVAAGETVAVMTQERIQYWDKADVPTTWNGIPAVNGDATDDRFGDPRGVVVLLGAKGPAGPESPMAFPLA